MSEAMACRICKHPMQYSKGRLYCMNLYCHLYRVGLPPSIVCRLLLAPEGMKDPVPVSQSRLAALEAVEQAGIEVIAADEEILNMKPTVGSKTILDLRAMAENMQTRGRVALRGLRAALARAKETP